MKGHVPAPYFSFEKSQISSKPLCMICSMDEMGRAQVLKLTRKKSRNRKLSRRKKNTVKYMHENCPVVARAADPEDDIEVSCIHNLGRLTCFEIAHHPRCRDLFTRIKRKGKFYCRTISFHRVV